MNNQEKINAMAFWWDYSNNYLTVDLIAEHHQMERADAQALIDSGREQWEAASVDDRQTAIDSMPEAYVNPCRRGNQRQRRA